MFFKMLAVVGVLVATHASAQPMTGAVTIEATYKVNVDGFNKVFFFLLANRYSTVRVITESGGAEGISIFDKKQQRIGFLAPRGSGEQFLPDPFERESARASYSKETLVNMYSLYAFALERRRKAAEKEFISFTYEDPKTKKKSYHGIDLILKSPEHSPFLPVDERIYGNRPLSTWNFAVRWVKSETHMLTKENYEDKGQVRLACLGYLVREGELRGTVLRLDADFRDHPLKPKAHLVLKELYLDGKNLKAP